MNGWKVPVIVGLGAGVVGICLEPMNTISYWVGLLTYIGVTGYLHLGEPE